MYGGYGGVWTCIARAMHSCFLTALLVPNLITRRSRWLIYLLNACSSRDDCGCLILLCDSIRDPDLHVETLQLSQLSLLLNYPLSQIMQSIQLNGIAGYPSSNLISAGAGRRA